MATITTRVIRNARRKGVKVYGRARWGSVHLPTYQWRRRYKKHAPMPSDTLVQHITVTFDSGRFVGNFKKDMRTVERIGWERFRSGVSYNWVVDMATGSIGLGQSLDAKGTHTVNNKNIDGFSYDQNLVAHAIAFLGMPGDIPTRKAIHSLVTLIAAMVEEGALTEGFDYMPHSAFAYKDCPTDAVRAVMPKVKIRALIKANRHCS